MRHCVSNDIDSQRIRNLDGEVLKELVVLTLAFPTVTDIAVVTEQRHHSALLVEVTLKVRVCTLCLAATSHITERSPWRLGLP